jgi:hypothetical protein
MSMVLAMLMAIAGPTKADLKQLGPVKDTPTVQLDPNAAYILLRSPAPVPINLFRIATPVEVEAYKVRRAEALAKAHRKWKSRHDDWVKNRETYRAQGMKVDEPVEPTEASFDFPPLDQENLLAFGPLNRFAKEKGGTSTYLQRVWPGRYVVYGSTFVNPNGGAVGFCVCMGTIAFDAKPGEIVDVGLVKTSATDALTYPNLLKKAEPDEVEGLRSGSITMMRWTPQNGSLPVDPRLAGYKVVPAQFKPAGPVPNYYGVQVDRMTAIPGVLAYDRDKIVDPAMQSSAASGQ